MHILFWSERYCTINIISTDNVKSFSHIHIHMHAESLNSRTKKRGRMYYFRFRLIIVSELICSFDICTYWKWYYPYRDMLITRKQYMLITIYILKMSYLLGSVLTLLCLLNRLWPMNRKMEFHFDFIFIHVYICTYVYVII